MLKGVPREPPQKYVNIVLLDSTKNHSMTDQCLTGRLYKTIFTEQGKEGYQFQYPELNELILLVHNMQTNSTYSIPNLTEIR